MYLVEKRGKKGPQKRCTIRAGRRLGGDDVKVT